jgi:hypothetical protein
MGKGNAAALANVIDLEAFRQKKMREEERATDAQMQPMHDAAMFVPVWFCWVPVWAPVT